jgi:hypothetical protein
MGDSKRIVSMHIDEVSGVDRPANEIPGWVLTKAADAVEALEKTDYTAEQRKTMAGNGQALPDGSFPIANVSDLENAIRAIGRASDPAAAKAHIKKRAAALGATDKIPDDWAKMDDKQTANLITKFLDFLKKSDDASKEELEMDKAELIAVLDEREAAQDERIAKAVGDALAAAKTADAEAAAEAEKVEKDAADKAAADAAAAADAGTATDDKPAEIDTAAFAKAEDVAAIAADIENITGTLEKVVETLGEVVKKGAARTSLAQEPAKGDDGEPVKKQFSGLVEAALSKPGERVTMTGPR